MKMFPAFAPVIVAGAILMLWLMLMAQAWQQSRSRRQLQRDLARIFEQLDLLALGAPSPAAASVPATALADAGARAASVRGSKSRDDSDTIAELIAGGASERELAARCGIAPAEARIMIAMRGRAGGTGTLQ